MDKIDPSKLELKEKIIFVNRVAKVVKGGRRFRFSVLMAVGDENGHVGLGIGKAKEVPEAARKGVEQAKKNLMRVPITNDTIPHKIIGRFGAGYVMLKPASPGTGVAAGGAVRPIVELAGIKNILTKCLGTNNYVNSARATMAGLGALRTRKDVAAARSKDIEEIRG